MEFDEVLECWGDPSKLSIHERAVYEEWLEAFGLNDEGYQAWYRKWLKSQDSSQYVRALAYGADCTAAHQDVAECGCLNDSLIGLYEFDDTDDPWKSSVSYDGTAYALDGTASLGAPKLGVKSAQFQGFLEGNKLYNANFPIDANEDFTIAFWLKHSDSASDQIILDSDKINLLFNYATGDFTLTVNTTSVTSVSHNHLFNTWTLLVLRKDSEYISIYGSYDGTTSLDCTSFDGTFSDAGGLTLSDTSHYIIGYIDELAIWQRCLSDEEVTWLDNTGDGRLISNFLCEGGVLGGGQATAGVWWSPEEVDGGVLVGGAAVLPFYEAMSGGAEVNGTSTSLLAFGPAATGGAEAGGDSTSASKYTPVISGGAAASGEATMTGTQSLSGSGGSLAGGRAEYPIFVTVGGGAETGGEALDIRSQSETGSGGAECGGTATVLIEILTSGGCEVDGSAVVGVTCSVDTSGGVRLNGSRVHPYTEDAGGGCLVDGEALVTKTVPSIEISGGILVDGEASEYWTLTMFGGAAASGEAPNTVNWWNVGEGGVITGMDPTFSNGYTYRMKFVVPVGAVSDDVERFPIILTGAPDVDDCDGTNFLVTDENDTQLTSCKFSYNTSTGRFHAIAITHLEADSTNTLYVYYMP